MKKEPTEIKSDITDHYDSYNFTNFWDDTNKAILNNYENKLIAKLTNKYFKENKGWLFDLGCGFGRVLPAYYNEKQNFVLIDYAHNQLEDAVKEHGDKNNVFYIAADACDLPFKDNVFNNGISIRLFHHIEKPEAFFNELNRITVNGSNIILTYINKRNFFRLFKYGLKSFKICHEKISSIIYGTHPKFINKMANTNNLKISAIHGSAFLHQLAHSSALITKIVDKYKILYRFFFLTDIFYNKLFGKLKLSLIQFVVFNNNKKNINNLTFNNIEDILKCKSCKNEKLFLREEYLFCDKCNRKYPYKNNIIDFRNPNI